HDTPCLAPPTAATVIFPVPLHAAPPIWVRPHHRRSPAPGPQLELVEGTGGKPRNEELPDPAAAQAAHHVTPPVPAVEVPHHRHRSEEHTSELQSRENLVCRLLLEKKNSQ